MEVDMNKFSWARLLRLSSIIGPLILITFFFTSCDNGSKSVGPSEPGALATLTITPDPVSMAIGATQQFVAVGTDADSNVVAVTPTWSVVAGGGTINSLGLFTAGTVNGIYTNTVKATSGSISGTVSVTVNAGALASITVTSNLDTLVVGGTRTFTAVGKDASGNTVSITPTWSVVAGGGTIDTSGVFTAGTTAGTFTNTVTATSGSVSSTATVVVNSGVLASITITPNLVTLAAGGSQTFTAEGRDASGNTVSITPTWFVVAGGGTIDTSGVFTAGTTAGTFTNTVTATSGSVSSTATVVVNSGVLASITITPNLATLTAGGSQTFTAEGRDASGNTVSITPTWSVVAGGGTIDGSGVFTAGTTAGTFTNTVTATSGSISSTATVVVNSGVLASITITPNLVTLAAGGTQTFTAVGRDASGNTVVITPSWSVVSGGGTINATTGVFTADTTPGTFINTVRALSGSISSTATVIVTANTSALTSITITPNSATLTAGGTQTFTAVGKDASGNTISITPTWSIEAGGGTINAVSGLFTAGTVDGTYINTVKASSGNISATVSVTVNTGALASISIIPNPVPPIDAGSTQQFTAVGRDANGNNITLSPAWSVEAGGGTIDAISGLFTAGTNDGTFTNTVRATIGGFVDVVSVTVKTGALSTVSITPNPIALSIGNTQQFVATGRDADGNETPISPTWSVEAGGGTINSSGLFTAGTTSGVFTNTVKATSGGISGTVSVTVTSGSLTTVSVTPNPVFMDIGSTQQFVAKGSDSGGNEIGISPTWSVIAGGGTIDAISGVFTAGTNDGTFPNTVQATSGSVSGTVTVTVSTGALASVDVTPNPAATMAIGSTQQFVATGKDVGGNEIVISPTWSVVAGGGTINSSGVFTAGTNDGTFPNTVQATSGSVSGTVSVTVNTGALASVSVTPNPAATMAIGGTQQFAATGKDVSGNTVIISPTWSVVAGGGTISSSGVFTAGTNDGTFPNTVQATSGSVSGTVSVTVNTGALASITVTPDPVTLDLGTAQTFTAVGKDASGNTISITPSWSVVSGGGTIDATTGVFTAGTTSGTFTNTVTASNGVGGPILGTATVMVNAGTLANITVTPNPVTLAIGGAQTFTAEGKDASGNTVTITPSPSWSVVSGGGTIDASTGVFTAGTTSGTFTNTVTASNGIGGPVSGTATVTVSTSALASITVTPNPDTLAIGGAQTFTAEGKDASGNTVTITPSPSWSVVAGGGTIDASTGVFTAGTTSGTFTNTVLASNGIGGPISGTATVTVTTGTLASITVAPNPDTLAIGGTQTFTALGKDASGNTVDFTPAWSVEASGGTIDASTGVFTAGATSGTFINTVKATNGVGGLISGTATVTVTNGALASITVTPDPDTLDTGGTRQFVAVGKDAGGNVIAFTPSWSVVADGGAIDGSGLFTAGFVGGTYTNTVRAFSGSISDSATVFVIPTGPAIVNLGTAGNFVILAKSAISTTGNTSVVGDMGLSPAAATFITGFTLSTPPTTFTTSPLVTGQVFASDYNAPTPSNLTTAISDMETAFTDAAGRTTPDFTELGAGNITGLNLVPGLYKWGTGVDIGAGGVTLTGGENAVWIFQIDQDLIVANAAIVTLSGGAQAKNIFWQVAGQTNLGTTSDFKGNILSKTLISLNTGAVFKGKILAQTAITLNAATVTTP